KFAWRFEMSPKLERRYKINAQNLFFNSIIRLISFGFMKVLAIDQEINTVFFKSQCARYFSSMFTNSIISSKYGASFGFLVQLMRFGFVGEDLRPYYKPKEGEFRFFGGWDCFSLSSSYHSNVQFFSIFPFFSYLPNWKIEFSGFFEHPKAERYIDIKQGRYGRFRFVNPRIILENETSEKIYNYFINLKVWLQDSTGLVPNVRDYFLLDTVSKYLKLFVLGKYIYLRYTTNYSLIRHAFQFYKINKIEICNPSASKQVLVDRDENRGPIDTEFVYIPFK